MANNSPEKIPLSWAIFTSFGEWPLQTFRNSWRTTVLVISLLWFKPGITAEYAKGLVFSSDAEIASFRTVPKYRAFLPDQVDLSHRFPAAGDQGLQGSCSAWAVAYGARSYYDAKDNNRRLDHRQAFSPSYIYNQIKLNSSRCDGGSGIYAALNVIRDQGVPRLVDFPYSAASCDRQPTRENRQQAQAHKIKDWRFIAPGNLESVKGELYRGHPVIVGMMVTPSFEDLRGRSVYSDERSRSSGGHAMVIVGYDDSRRAFRVFNSWGQSWGEPVICAAIGVLSRSYNLMGATHDAVSKKQM